MNLCIFLCNWYIFRHQCYKEADDKYVAIVAFNIQEYAEGMKRLTETVWFLFVR